MSVTPQMTADDLLQLPDDGYRYELVQGELRKMSPTGARHGNDTCTEVAAKTQDYLRAGTRVVIIVDPQTKRVEAHRPSGSVEVVDVLEIEDIIPGWCPPLAELFA